MPHHKRSSSITSLCEALSSHEPSTFSAQPQPRPTLHIPSIKYTATKLQCISNYKLRLESSKNEPKLSHLLGHISIYDAVREWRQSQVKASIQTIMEATGRLPSPTPLAASSLEAPDEEPEARPNEFSRCTHETQVPSFQDFQAAIELQLATMEHVKAAQRQLQQMAHDSDDGEEVEEYQSDSEAESDYDSYDGDEADWRRDEDSADNDSDDSMTDPESVRSECSSPVEDVDCEKEHHHFSLKSLTPAIASCIIAGA